MENHLDFIVIKAEPRFRADSFVLDEADYSAAPDETGIIPVTLSLYACDKRDTAARRAQSGYTGCRRDPPARNDLSHAPRLSAGACLSAGRPRRPADAACRKQCSFYPP